MIIREVRNISLAAYVCAQVANGYTALSDVVFRTFDAPAGALFLIMPENLAPERVENWNWDPGHLKWEAADRLLAQAIRAYLLRPQGRVIIQDFETQRSDPGYTDDPLRVFHGDGLYWELQGTDLSEDTIIRCIWDASCWPWLAYFCKRRVDAGRVLEESDLEEVASGLVGLAVQALHDSYVIWWRTDLEPFPQPE